MTRGPRSPRHETRPRLSAGRTAILVATVAVIFVAVSGFAVGLVPPASPGPTSPASPSAPSAAPFDATIDQLIGRLRASHPAIYDSDGVPGTADDLTGPLLDAILAAGDDPTAPPDAHILANLTAIELAVATTDIGARPAAGADAICWQGTVGVASIPGAARLFNGDEPIVAHVLGTLETLWTGRLTTDRADWTFQLDGADRTAALATVRAMTEGRAILTSGCLD